MVSFDKAYDKYRANIKPYHISNSGIEYLYNIPLAEYGKNPNLSQAIKEVEWYKENIWVKDKDEKQKRVSNCVSNNSYIYSDVKKFYRELFWDKLDLFYESNQDKANKLFIDSIKEKM